MDSISKSNGFLKISRWQLFCAIGVLIFNQLRIDHFNPIHTVGGGGGSNFAPPNKDFRITQICKLFSNFFVHVCFQHLHKI